MSGEKGKPGTEISEYVERLDRDAEAGGYHLNPDREFVEALARGLMTNEERFGYAACPCRLASGDRRSDLDIVCPCDYRDPDLSEWGTCYCALYVSAEVRAGKREIRPVPERRPPGGAAGARGEDEISSVEAERSDSEGDGGVGFGGRLSHPVWRCSVCGYLCARDDPPDTCPICKADKDRFRRFA